VVVKFHESARLGVQQWYASLGATRDQRKEARDALLAALREHFRQHAGFPPTAVPDRSRHPPVWVWRFTTNLYLEYVVQEVPPPPRGWWDVIHWARRLARRPTRVVTITAVADSPPPRRTT
jgi:hypothetical protein